MIQLKKYAPIVFLVIAFTVLYALISLVNHYLFRTYALDLGLYTHAAYQYAHFKLADSTMIKGFYEPLLGSHFDIYLVLFSPLTHLLGSWTLLIVQIFAVLLGGIGVYQVVHYTSQSKWHATIAAAYFYCFFGIISAVSFDYHSVVVATAAVPWLFYFVHRDKIHSTILTTIFIWIAQENLSVWMIFVCFGLAIQQWKHSKMRWLLGGLSLGSAFYFYTVTQWLIPGFSSTQAYTGFVYSSIGDSPLDVIKTIVLHPIDSIKIIFTDHLGKAGAAHIKLEFHLLLLASGLYLLFLRPIYLMMLFPLYIQKFFHDNPAMWSCVGQYGVEFAPIMAIGTFHALAGLSNKALKTTLTVLLLASCMGASIRIMNHTEIWTNKSQIRVFRTEHYEKNYTVGPIHDYLKSIPNDVKISVQSPFVPHLALRQNIYEFPVIKDAEFIVYSHREGTFPLEKGAFDKLASELENSAHWKVIFQHEGFMVLGINKAEVIQNNLQ